MFKFKEFSLLCMLTGLTLVFIFAQLYLFAVDYKVSDLVDSLVGTSISLQLFHPVILLPLIAYLLLQITAYVLFVSWIWFVTISITEWFKLRTVAMHIFGSVTWCMACFSMLELNRYYFPDSLFARLMTRVTFLNQYGEVVLVVMLALLFIITLIAYFHFFWCKRYRYSGSILLLCIVGVMAPALFRFESKPFVVNPNAKPNIIIIGLDSLRPDYTNFYGNKNVYTPNIDNFLDSAITFSESYTPLARTFPSWMSILTAKYPIHNQARNNLIEPAAVIKHDMLSRKLQQSGYETIYATDEKRFSNITNEYGFDRILGPGMGVDDFLLGGLSDFPLNNLLVNLPAGRFLFPYNYGNRAATITYQPDAFLQLIKSGLGNLTGKPVFLSIHLCLAHWPGKWADKGREGSVYLSSQYARSVSGLDKQLGALIQILKESGLLENSWVVILSDHGTALGMPNDRIISEVNYQGNKQNMEVVARNQFSALPHQNNKPVYSVNTAYGQGTNILSLTQNHVLLAFKRYGSNLAKRKVNELVSLLDVAPTLLDMLDISPLADIDGISLRPYFSDSNPITSRRAFFMETGDTLSEIETDHIYIEKVIKHEIGIYGIHPMTGLLTMSPIATTAIVRNKQLAIMWHDWILAHYPATVRKKKVIPPYFVLVNVKTGQWTVELSSPFAKAAPLDEMLQQLKDFYGNEMPG